MPNISRIAWVSVTLEGAQFEVPHRKHCASHSIQPHLSTTHSFLYRQEMETSSPYVESDSGGEFTPTNKGKAKATAEPKGKKRVR